MRRTALKPSPCRGPGGTNVPREPLPSPGAGRVLLLRVTSVGTVSAGLEAGGCLRSAGCAVAGADSRCSGVWWLSRKVERGAASAGTRGRGQSASRTRPASGPQATAGAVLWRQSLRRLRAAFVNRQSDRAAVRPRRRNRSMRRLNLALGKVGSITPERFADSSSSSVTPPARTAPRPALSPTGRAIASPTKSALLRARSERRRHHRLKDLADSLGPPTRPRSRNPPRRSRRATAAIYE